MTDTLTIPEWTTGDRMRKARRHAQIRTDEMAEQLGCSRTTITNYESGRSEPTGATLIAWATLTGVELDWLRGCETIRYHIDDEPLPFAGIIPIEPWPPDLEVAA